jgi:hypothetical protein
MGRTLGDGMNAIGLSDDRFFIPVRSHGLEWWRSRVVCVRAAGEGVVRVEISASEM